MTIGIAAIGPNAGHAILEALRAVEKIGSGAIGGFVSFVAIDAEDRLVRAETQTGGAGDPAFREASAPFRAARIAALMSSGPNRPSPLSQFTPGDPGVALLTGHRLPNTVTPKGSALNIEVLERLRHGEPVARALADVLYVYPEIDAGLIAITVAGDVAMADTRYVARFFDAGSALLTSEFDPGIKVAVMHNAIQPWRGLALVAAQTALNVMDPPDRFDETIMLRKGMAIRQGERNSIVEAGGQISIAVENRSFLRGRHDLGLGPRAAIDRNGKQVGVAVYEPYLTVDNGMLMTIDGASTFDLPIRRL